MKIFRLERCCSLPQPLIFKISTDVENFHHVMPDYFKSLTVIESSENKKIVIEKIKFLGINLKIKTLHIITKPNKHQVHILSGPLRGTVFVESYIQSENNTIISIDVKLNFSGLMKLFGFLEGVIVKKMSHTMNEFIVSAENFASANYYSKS